VAGADATVLFLVRTGIGKELMPGQFTGTPSVRAGHSSAELRRHPSQLIASELLRPRERILHRAVQRRIGRFEQLTAESIFLAKSANWRLKPRSPCSGCCRKESSSGRKHRRSRWTCASWPQAIAT